MGDPLFWPRFGCAGWGWKFFSPSHRLNVFSDKSKKKRTQWRQPLNLLTILHLTLQIFYPIVMTCLAWLWSELIRQSLEFHLTRFWTESESHYPSARTARTSTKSNSKNTLVVPQTWNWQRLNVSLSLHSRQLMTSTNQFIKWSFCLIYFWIYSSNILNRLVIGATVLISTTVNSSSYPTAIFKWQCARPHRPYMFFAALIMTSGVLPYSCALDFRYSGSDMLLRSANP